MNAIEEKHLMSYDLSHIAKSLYTFFLRPLALQNQNVIDLTCVANYLFNSSKYFPTTPNFKIATMCLDELEEKGLIKKDNQIWQGAHFTLPYFVDEAKILPQAPFVLSLDWEPGPTFKENSILCGLEDCTYTKQDLQNFRTYWAGRNETRNQVGWERAFAQRLLKSRIGKTSKVVVTKSTALGQVDYVEPKGPTNVATPQTQAQLEALFK